MGTSSQVSGWYRDPARRFEHRYWNGTAWTDHVLSGGQRMVDPDHSPPAPTRPAAAPVAAVAPVAAAAATATAWLDEPPVPLAPPAPTPATVRTPATPSAPTAPTGWRAWPIASLVAVGVGALLLVVGSALPWAVASSTRSSFSENGIDGFGAVTIVAALLIIVVVVVVNRPRDAAAITVAVAAIAGAVALYEVADTSRKADDLVAHARPGVTAGVGFGLWLTLAAAAFVLVAAVVTVVVTWPRER